MIKPCLFLTVCLPLLLCGQTATFSFRNININQGLSQNSVVSITQDNAGFLWFATQDGLNKYDGQQFEIYQRNFDDVTTLSTAKLGKLHYAAPHDLWMIKTGGQLEKMNLLTNQSIPVSRIGRDSFPLPPVSAFLIDSKGNKWIGFDAQGLLVVDKKGSVVFRSALTSVSGSGSGTHVQEIFEDSKQGVWVITSHDVSLFKGTGENNWDPIKRIPTTTSLSCIDEDRFGNLWFGSFGGGLKLLRSNASQLENFPGFETEESLPSTLVIETILIDRQGRLWAGTYGNGLYLLNFMDSSVRHFRYNKKDSRSLGYDDILAICEDRHGGIWIGTDGGGVSYYSRRLNHFSLLSTNLVPDGISLDQVRSITTDGEGGAWIGTSSTGLVHADFNNESFQAYTFKPFSKVITNYQRIVSLQVQGDDLWIGSQGNGLLIMNRHTGKVERIFHPDASEGSIVPDHTVWSMVADGDSRMWIATRNAGIALVSRKQGLVHNFRFFGQNGFRPEDNNVRSMFRINDSLLCLGFDRGDILFFNTRTHQSSSPGAELGLLRSSGTVLKCLYYADSVIWIGTLGKGLFSYDLRSHTLFHIDDRRGLPNNTVYGILPDNLGRLWLSTNKGLCRFQPPSDISSTSRFHFKQYTVEYGLQSNEFNTGAYHRSINGRLYFGGSDGLNFFDPADLDEEPLPSRLLITRASINNQSYEGDTAIAYKTELSLGHDQNSLSFDFVALDFVSSSGFNYYYMLEGYDRDWVQSGRRNYAAYTNLPPGEYVFMARASQTMPSAVDSGVAIRIVIHPPFWLTWWFILLCGLAISALLLALYRYRIRQILQVQSIRNRIATDLHDDIGSALTNISLLSELSKKNQSAGSSSLFLDRISEEVNRSSEALDDIVWSINTRNDTLDQTVARMRRYAADIFDGAGIRYSLKFDDQFAEKRLNMEQRRDCFLIFKEAVNNIYKHAGAQHVNIRIWIERDHLHMEIEDDGKGFDPSSSTHRNGLRNIRQRTARWKGTASFVSEPGKGTRLQIEFGDAG